MKLTCKILTKYTFWFLILTINFNVLFSQDTTYYSYDTFSPLARKEITNKKIYELIKISKDTFKLEKCNYYGLKRSKLGRPYVYIVKKDTITIPLKKEKWYHKKKNDSLYFVSMQTEDFKTIGYARSVIPFIKHGNFITYNSDNEIVITEFYKNNKLTNWIIPNYKIEDKIFIYTKNMPKYIGGKAQIRSFLGRNFSYPKLSKENRGISGTVYIKFVVDNRGWVKNPQIMKGLCSEIDNECLRIISKLPKFIPEYQNGKPINVWYNIEFTIGE